ncbi:uncharacterized acetyltransferase At3g50280-like [Nymphaea colorata]|uniref:Acetyltransferase n=1 Tax=Nymphaea colorata TaxID=210225 RepID=A0A5K1D4B2_9MAGN|nr:uncharacterized acetyltransferase At3g50280-like [Nymphaea colorata]
MAVAPSKCSSSSSVSPLSECTVFPESPSIPVAYKLTVSDLPMLSCQYIQKGVLLPCPPDALLSLLKDALSRTLVHFPLLAGRLRTDADGYVYVDSDGSGVPFVHAAAPGLKVGDVLAPQDVPEVVRGFFAMDGAVSYEGHFRPLAAVQVTELADGVFVGATVNHSLLDGTSFWNFFNTWAEIARGCTEISRPPDSNRFFVKDSAAVLRFDAGRALAPPKVAAPPLRERIFSFSRRAVVELKEIANQWKGAMGEEADMVEVLGKASNDAWKGSGKGRNGTAGLPAPEVSSFQSLCAQIWRSVTRARRLPATTKTTTFRMAVNCRHRVSPRMHAEYFGNAIQSVPATVEVAELLRQEVGWAAWLLHQGVAEHWDAAIRGRVEEWERAPRVFPLGNPDGAAITMGSSSRFPMYDNDFGWGRPVAIRSGRANKFDGKMSAFPGWDGAGSVDVEMCLAADTMTRLERDPEFMQYVTLPQN